ncbi:MAG TPA: histidine phosphatase family protein [Pyrinomonadaceae bacterium]|jgi:phosphohistidine phosphatase|nr:histidine phosphatase family protein [Pyrinomonadaceae bacterium]
MKTLLLMRHAKSDWQDAGMRDFDRPLNKRGLRDAPAVGGFLRKQQLRPGLVLSSPAERARQTAALVVAAAQLDAAPLYDGRIYEATAAQLAEVVAGADDSADVLLLVGHNPGMEDFIGYLTGEARGMPTAALARVALDIERWGDVRESCGRLEWIVKPEELESVD